MISDMEIHLDDHCENQFCLGFEVTALVEGDDPLSAVPIFFDPEGSGSGNHGTYVGRKFNFPALRVSRQSIFLVPLVQREAPFLYTGEISTLQKMPA